MRWPWQRKNVRQRYCSFCGRWTTVKLTDEQFERHIGVHVRVNQKRGV